MNVLVDPRQAAASGAPATTRRPSAWTRVLRRVGLGALLAGLGLSVCAASQPRDLLWTVESACLLDHKLTGAPFPCLVVDPARGITVLEAPFRHPHVVAMPIARIVGTESPEVLAADSPNYFQAAWDERGAVQANASRPLAWSELGLAINSRVTRSQDQLHIHIDCVKRKVKAILMDRLSQFPSDEWQPAGLIFQRQSYWVRRVDRPSLAGLNVFALAHEIPAVEANPALTVLAVLGVTDPSGHDGFLLLAGQSDPARGAAQSTSEDLLDHSCTRPPD